MPDLSPPPTLTTLLGGNDLIDFRWGRWIFDLFQKVFSNQVRINVLESLIVDLVPSAYGAVNELAPVPGFDLGAGWRTLPFDNESLTSARGVTFDLANNTFQMDEIGVWRWSVGFSLEGHNSDNSGRATSIRFFNETTATPSGSFVIGIGRNVEDTSAGLGSMFEITDTSHVFRVEVGGGDVVTGGIIISAYAAFNYLSRLGSLT